MNMIAYCGLDCEKCEARLATVQNDDGLRAKVAKSWSEMNGVEITPEMIRCEGCRSAGVKSVYCDSLCAVRRCAISGGYDSCGACARMSDCEKVRMITEHNAEALANLNEFRK